MVTQQKNKAQTKASGSAGKTAEPQMGAGEDAPSGEVGEEEVLLRWKASVRPFKKRDREYYTTIAAIAFLIIIILAFLREFLLIAVVVAFAFVSYVFATVPPEETEHELTNRGIRSAKKLYRWSDLQRYWFDEKFGQKMIVVQTHVLFPGQLLLMMSSVDEEKLRAIFNKYLPHEEPNATFLDKSSRWLSEKIPLEKEAAAGKSSSSSRAKASGRSGKAAS